MEESKREQFLHDYLNDHMAGSVAAVELLENLIDHSSGQRRQFYEELLEKIRADQQQLEDVISRVEAPQSTLKKTASWLGEKLSRFKFDTSRRTYGELSSVEELEALALGIRGKLSLWTLFAEVYSEDHRFSEVDFRRLIGRAQSQIEAIDQLRIETARELLPVRTTG